MQWLSSEREKRSVVPRPFWYLSIGGAVILLAYAVHRQDIVFVLGQSAGLFIYVRNLQLIRNEAHRRTVRMPMPESEIIHVTAKTEQPELIHRNRAA